MIDFMIVFTSIFFVMSALAYGVALLFNKI